MKKNKQILVFDLTELKRLALYWLILGVGFVTLTFLITSTWIGVEVKNHCRIAQYKYEGDCVEALIQVVDNENNSFSERNYAIWSLGQLGDTRAREVLEKYYTGVIPAREPYDQGLSQYEMKKALNLLKEDSLNISRWVWGN